MELEHIDRPVEDPVPARHLDALVLDAPDPVVLVVLAGGAPAPLLRLTLLLQPNYRPGDKSMQVNILSSQSFHFYITFLKIELNARIGIA